MITKIKKLQKEIEEEEKKIRQNMIDKIKESGLLEMGRKIVAPIPVNLDIIPALLRLEGEIYWSFDDECYNMDDLKIKWIDKKNITYKLLSTDIENTYIFENLYDHIDLFVSKETMQNAKSYPDLIEKWSEQNDLDMDEVIDYLQDQIQPG